MAYAQMRFEGAAEHHNGGPTCLVFKREDGHELSLSSYRKGLIHFDGGDTVKDYGSFVTAEQFLAALLEFTASPILPPAETVESSKPCQGGCGKVKSIVLRDTGSDDWICFDCSRKG